MTFKFSDQDQEITIYNLSKEGEFLSDELILIEAGTGLPAMSTHTPPPSVNVGEVAIFEGDSWEVKPDYRGKTSYSKATKEPAEVTEIGEIEDTHTLLAPIEYSSWLGDEWVYDQELERPIKSATEKDWRNAKLKMVLDRIDQYEKDLTYPEDLRTSPFDSDQYTCLLKDRKLLSDYPACADFPFGERPDLSGLV